MESELGSVTIPSKTELAGALSCQREESVSLLIIYVPVTSHLVLTFSSISAIPYPGTLSTFEDVIYYSGGGSSLAAVSVFDGTVIWEYISTGQFTSSPEASPDNSRVYGVTGLDGIVALTTMNGDEIWNIKCNDLDTSSVPCLSRIQGDFSLSSDGLFLYFGDIGGNVRAIQVGDPGAPSAAPSMMPGAFPGDDRKSRVPTLAPSVSGVAPIATYAGLFLVAVAALLV